MEVSGWLNLVIVCVLYYRDASAVMCSLRVVRIKNGDYSLRSSNTVVTFTCDPGFTLLGSRQIICFGSDWSTDPPICISNTCQNISQTPTLRIKKQYDGAILKFSCTVMHKIVGTDRLVCDGTNWSDSPPTCIAYDPPKSCDFEDSELCGWSHHDEDDQEWRWNTGATKTTRTGPKHDHTLGADGMGHYMYFETSSPTRTGHQAWLSSPLYPTNYSGGEYCFQFWYHSLGIDGMGELEVLIKPELSNLSDSTQMFHLNRSIGELWQREVFPIQDQAQPFQIFFVAERGSGYRSDFGIDDVTLGKCSDFIMSTTVSSTPTTSATTPTTPRPKLGSTFITNDTRTTLPPKTTLPKTTSPKTTLAKTTLRKTTLKPSTIFKVKTTLSTTKVKPTQVPTIKTTKPNQITTTLNARKSKVPSVKTTPATGIQSTTEASRVLSRSSGKGESSAVKVAFIFVGIGICAVIAIAIGIVILIRRRKGKHIFWSNDSSFAAENPLYNAVANDESAVQFGNMNEN